MIEREITSLLQRLARASPVVTVTGPRQSGKTTLCRATFDGMRYLNLENPDEREFAQTDPRGFLALARGGAVIDEIQRVPQLLSYIQGEVDETGRAGQFVLTGSEQFRLSDAVGQSLAGRTALLRLLPFSLAERARTGASDDIDEIIATGFYPRIYDEGLEPSRALADYFETYVERDVRRTNEIRNLTNFRRFVRLCAGRVGQLLNLNSLGTDVGISHGTAREWLTILERSYIVFLLQPYHANIRKRLVKSPKMYFCDTGLASYLIGIDHPSQVAAHPLRGQLFENIAVTEALKQRLNRGRDPRLTFFRDSNGLECDLLCETGEGIAAMEIKSSTTVTSSFFTSLHKVAELVPDVASKTVVYGGAQHTQRNGADVVPLAGVAGVLDRLHIAHEVAEFIERKRGPGPSERDVEVVDAVYRAHVQPLVAGVLPHCEQIGSRLFSEHRAWGRIGRGQNNMDTQEWFAEPGWLKLREELIAVPGFRLSGDEMVRFNFRYHFMGYEGVGTSSVGTHLRLDWLIDGATTRRTVEVGTVPQPHLDAQFSHEDVMTASPQTDSLVSRIVEALMASLD
ncbi:ATP-binding protein [Candidatus Poriferisodalis sp.]|uniref:ATP-binding protein n=1 Tax=Candidatus Poriferisodalis sp. TaxID=3101277 RepID=UPI003B029328